MDIVLYVRVFVEGLMAFAAVHYLFQWWWSKQETMLLGFSIFCAMVAVLNHAMANVSMATTVEAAAAAMNQRTIVGLLALPLLAWLVSRIGDVAAPRFIRTVSAVLGSAALLTLLGLPVNGTVEAVHRVAMPWGGTTTVLERSGIGWWTVPLFLMLLSVPVFNLRVAWLVRRRDRMKGRLLLGTGVAALVGLVGSALVDVFRLPVPFLTFFTFAIWVPVLSLILSREHASRGERLQTSEALYRTMIESAPEAIVVLDGQANRFVDCNRAATEMLGWSRAELLTKSPLDISPVHQPNGRRSADLAPTYLAQAAGGGEPIFAWTHCDREGNTIPCEVRLVRLPAPDATLIRGSMIDMRDRLRLEEQLRQSQKMEAVGQLAGGIAHDFNNLLTVIQGTSEMIQEDLPSDSPLLDDLKSIRDATERAAALTQRLMAFSRRALLAPRVVELNAVVRESEQLLRRLIGEELHLDVVLDPVACRVKVDVAHLGQVIMNLVINARDAMPSGGLVTLATSTIAIDPGSPESERRPTGRYARLTVRDTGTGMTPEVRARVFEPFFTTKEVGKGTGLGLAVAHGIVKQSGGYIDIDSEPGRGTTVTVDLPEAVEEAHAEAAATPVAASGTETILLVEDEAAVQSLLTRVLDRHGFKVLTAGSGAEAIAIVQQSERLPDLLVTDVVMPGMAGRELAETLRREHPHLKVLFVSGYSEDVLLQKGVKDGYEALLAKPFHPQELVTRVRRMLDEA